MNEQNRLLTNWITLSIDYPYYKGINEDRANMWRQLTKLNKLEIKNKYLELYHSHRKRPNKKEYNKSLEKAKLSPDINLGYPSYEERIKGGDE